MEKVIIEFYLYIKTEVYVHNIMFSSCLKEDGKRYYKDAEGIEKLAPNGYYDPKDSSIHIDLNAGNSGEGTMLFTVSHELVHYIKHWSKSKFNILADFLLEQYAEKGVSVEALVQAQIEKAKAVRNEDIDPDTAFEEVIADSMESMLTDGKVAEKLTMLAEKDKLASSINYYDKQLLGLKVTKDLKILEEQQAYKADMLSKLDRIEGTKEERNQFLGMIESNTRTAVYFAFTDFCMNMR